jgi:hypothetical protein
MEPEGPYRQPVIPSPPEPAHPNRARYIVLSLAGLAVVATGLVALATIRGGLLFGQPAPSATPVPTAIRSQTATPITEPSPSPEPTPGYLAITELGLRVPLSAADADLTYTYSKYTPDEGNSTGFAQLSSKSVLALGADCTGALGTIGRTQKSDVGFANLAAIVGNGSVLKFGTYYVYYQTPQSACSADSSATGRQLEQQQRAALQADFAKTAPIQ